jgi:hypothetical protein
MVNADGAPNVLVDCHSCGHTKVAPPTVTVRNCLDTDTWSYWFVCPSCESRTAAGTQPGPALAAVHAGARLETWHLPAELNEHNDAPPLSVADVLKLRIALTEPDWIDRLAT